MDNLNDLKAIWQTADVSNLPQVQEIKTISKDYQQKTLVKKAWLAGATVLCSALFLLSMFFNPSPFPSTRIGELFILIALAILIWTSFKSLNRIYKIRNCSNQEFIPYLREVQRNRMVYYQQTQVAGMAFYSAGLLLYLYQLVYRNTYFTVFFYVLTLLALAGFWFYIRPKAYQKRKNKFEPFLQHIEKLSKQMTVNEKE